MEWMVSWGGVFGLVGVLSGGEIVDRVGEGDFGGVVGCMKLVKPEVEDIVRSV